MAGQRNELPRTGIPAVPWPLQPGLWTPAPAEGAPGDPTPTAPEASPQRPLLALGPSGRQSSRGSVQGQESGLRPPDFSRKGGVGRCVRIASSARARTPPQRKETDPTGASTHVAPAPRAPSSLPTPTPSPYLPKCPTLSKISSKLLDPMVPPCTTLRSGTRDARLVQGTAGTAVPCPAPPGPRGPPAAALASPARQRARAARGARLCSSFFSSSESPPSRPFARRAVLPEPAAAACAHPKPRHFPLPPRRPIRPLTPRPFRSPLPRGALVPGRGGPPGSPRWGTQIPLLGTNTVFSEKSARLGPTRAEHKEWILMTLRSGRILQSCVKQRVLTEGQRELPG